MTASVLKGQHWLTAPKPTAGGQKLTEEEKIRFREWTPIAHDDETAICTRRGWERYQRERHRRLRQMQGGKP